MSRNNFSFPEIESENDPTRQEVRRAMGSSDDLRVYKAKIYKIMGKGDDRLQVLPLSMFGIKKDEMKYLPRFPALIKGEVITGASIDEVGPEKAESVWVLATPDFSTGYVIGKANSFGENTDVKWPYSYAFDNVMNFLFGRRVDVVKDYMRYEVVMARDGEDGGMIELVDRKNGDWVLFNQSGTVIALTQHKLLLRAGTPPSPPSAGPVGFSQILMTADQLQLKSPNIDIDGVHVSLGHHGMNVAGMPTTSPALTYAGAVIVPIENVKC